MCLDNSSRGMASSVTLNGVPMQCRNVRFFRLIQGYVLLLLVLKFLYQLPIFCGSPPLSFRSSREDGLAVCVDDRFTTLWEEYQARSRQELHSHGRDLPLSWDMLIHRWAPFDVISSIYPDVWTTFWGFTSTPRSPLYLMSRGKSRIAPRCKSD